MINVVIESTDHYINYKTFAWVAIGLVSHACGGCHDSRWYITWASQAHALDVESPWITTNVLKWLVVASFFPFSIVELCRIDMNWWYPPAIKHGFLDSSPLSSVIFSPATCRSDVVQWLTPWIQLQVLHHEPLMLPDTSQPFCFHANTLPQIDTSHKKSFLPKSRIVQLIAWLVRSQLTYPGSSFR